jgi:hypothetical protein
MPGSQTSPDPSGARSNAPADFAFHQVNNVGTRVANDFAAQWLAYALPYRRFADDLADVCARIGATWIATPSSQWTFTTYSSPVSRRTHSHYGPPDRSTALRRPLSRGSNPAGYPTKPLAIATGPIDNFPAESSSTDGSRLRGARPRSDIG